MKNFNEINAVSAETGFAETPQTYSVSLKCAVGTSEARSDARRSAALRSSRLAREKGKRPGRRTGWTKLQPGDKTITVGGRKLYLRPDQFEVERNGKWVVHLIKPAGDGEWTNIKLYDYHKKARKKVYYLSLRRKELTLAVGYDAGVFEKRHPELIAWVTEVLIRCRNNFGGKREGENVGG